MSSRTSRAKPSEDGFTYRSRRSDDGDDFSYNFVCTLRMGLKTRDMKLYSGPQDDKDICEYGGNTLSIGGLYFEDKTHVLIEDVSSSLYFANGWSLELIKAPFVINMKTRKYVPFEEFDKLGMGRTPARRPKSRGDAPNFTAMAAASRADEIQAIVQHGGLPQYVEWIWSQQEHIMSIANAKHAASAHVKPAPWTPEALEAWFDSIVAARAHADIICHKTPITV
jgi:hypothetical protein